MSMTRVRPSRARDTLAALFTPEDAMSRHAGVRLLRCISLLALAAFATWLAPTTLSAQGVTTAQLNGLVTDTSGAPLSDASVAAVHLPSGTSYRAPSRAGAPYPTPKMPVPGPPPVTVPPIASHPLTRPP